MPEAACGGVQNVLAIIGQDTKVSKAAQQRDSLLLRFKTEDEVSIPNACFQALPQASCTNLVCDPGPHHTGLCMFGNLMRSRR